KTPPKPESPSGKCELTGVVAKCPEFHEQPPMELKDCPDAQRLLGARVRARLAATPGAPWIDTKTVPGGEYKLVVPFPGRYECEASKEGLPTVSKQVDVRSARTTADFLLPSPASRGILVVKVQCRGALMPNSEVIISEKSSTGSGSKTGTTDA